MKKLFTTALLATSLVVQSQTLPLDFESTTSGMTGYDGATFTIVSNPDMAGNSSAQVAKIVKVTPGDLWAGGKITGVTSLDFSSSASSVLSMKVYTTEPVGTVIKVKLENPYSSEVDAVTTVSGAWETLTFDFGIPAPNGSADLVIMPQPFTAGGGNTFYIDDVSQVAGIIAPKRAGLPITFESGTTARHFFSFESAIMTGVANPASDLVNSSSNVGKIVRHLGAPYGGSKITFSSPVDYANHPTLTMDVWTTASIGTNVTLKGEKPFWGEERTVQTTKSGEWETLSFDFSNAPGDMPTLTLLFDFIAGSTNVGDGSASSTFYFDNIKYSDVPLGERELQNESQYSVFPNPSSSQWVIRGLTQAVHRVELYSMQGALLHAAPTFGSNAHSIDASNYAAGMYLVRIHSVENSTTLQVLKN